MNIQAGQKAREKTATEIMEGEGFIGLPTDMQQIILEKAPLCSGRLITNNLALTCKALFSRFCAHYARFSMVVNEKNLDELLEREKLEPKALEERNLKKLSEYRYVFIDKEITEFEQLSKILSTLKSVVSLQIGYISHWGQWVSSFSKLQKLAIELIGEGWVVFTNLQPKLHCIAIGNRVKNSNLIITRRDESVIYPSLESILLFGDARVYMDEANYPSLIEVNMHRAMSSLSLRGIIAKDGKQGSEIIKKHDEGPRENLLLGPDLIDFPALAPENAVKCSPVNGTINNYGYIGIVFGCSFLRFLINLC